MNSSIEFYQEFKSNEILSSFMSLVPPMCLAIRDGHPAETLASELVVGDVLAVKSGDKIPADMRLIHTVDFKVDNSSITGESEPQERSTAACLGPPLEASNLALSGTMAVSGEAQGIVIRTGDHSVLGQIAKLTCSSKDRPSQMSQEISVFVKKIALIAFTTALFFFVYGLIRAYDIGMTFSFAIGLFVAFVPQGIPATVTLLLTIAAKRLSRKNVLVKDLQGVETLGAITLLATDKTGTLTQNRMSVFGAWINGRIYSATGIAESASEQLLEPDTPNLQKLIDACALCTKSRFDPADMGKPIEERNIFGDATEAGLLRFAANFTDATQYMEDHPKVFEIPFNSASKWHLAVNSLPHEKGPLTMFIKGAPERVAALCKFIQVDDKILPWTEDTTSQFNQAYESFASRGQRVLAFGFKHLEEGEYPADYQFTRDPRNFPENEFTFAGLISLMDPPKRGVRKAVAACRTAGIQVVMVTGDHPLTAEVRNWLGTLSS
jgi:sodium/potassium-transporting ATPase subunit alpha